MSKDHFKTRLEIAKEKIKSKYLPKDKDPKSYMGIAFKMSAELISTVAVGTITVSYTHLTLPTTPYV